LEQFKADALHPKVLRLREKWAMLCSQEDGTRWVLKFLSLKGY